MTMTVEALEESFRHRGLLARLLVLHLQNRCPKEEGLGYLEGYLDGSLTKGLTDDEIRYVGYETTFCRKYSFQLGKYIILSHCHGGDVIPFSRGKLAHVLATLGKELFDVYGSE